MCHIVTQITGGGFVYYIVVLAVCLFTVAACDMFLRTEAKAVAPKSHAAHPERKADYQVSAATRRV